jgi:hypothetical protein
MILSINSNPYCLKLKEQMKKTSPEAIKEDEEELRDWEKELARVQALLPAEGARNKIIHVEVPALELKIKEQESNILPMTDATENVR